MKFKTVQTARLRIREFEERDRAFLMEFTHDPGQLGFMLFSLANEGDVDRFMDIILASQRDARRKEWHLLAELLPGGAAPAAGDAPLPIGGVGLMGAEPGAEAELGYFFLKPYWGKGFAVEAAAPLLDFAFGSVGLHRVWGKCHSENAGSARVMEKLGMTKEGTIREHVWLRDHWRTSHLFGILDREWNGE